MPDPFNVSSGGGHGVEAPKSQGRRAKATPPGLVLLAKEQAATKRQEAGKNPSVTPLDILHGVERLLNPPPPTFTDPKTGKSIPVSAPTFFTGGTAAADALRHLPSIVGGAHAQAVKLAHAKQAPSVRGDLSLLLSGAIGIPRGGLKHEQKYPPGTLFHGSPEGQIKKVDALHHTKAWREGPGFYLTSDAAKAAKYAEGKTAKATRRTGNGAVNAYRIKSGANVLNLDVQPPEFWHALAEKIAGKVDPATYALWAKDILPEEVKGASVGIVNRQRLMHFLTGYEEMPKTDAYYAIEDALHNSGVQATLHYEGGVPVHIVKDASVLERVHPTVPHPLLAATRPHVPGSVPRIPKGVITPETGGDLGKQVREGLRGAKSARAEQDRLYSVERGKRSRAADQAMKDIGGRAGYDAALGKLKGELPKLQFKGMENFDQAGVDALFNHVQAHPTLRPYEKIRTQTALLNVLNGKVPTKSEIALLGEVFGKEVTTRIAASVPTWAKLKNVGIELLNVPRSLMASVDMSAPFRQGLVSGAAHPVMFAKNFAPMIRAFGSEKAYHAIMDDIASRPTFAKMQESRLGLTELGGLTQREEQFASNYAERIPVAGRVVRGSGRAYVGFLNKMRADYFDYMVESASKAGLDPNDKQLLSSISRYINSATGRGDLGALREHAVTLNTVFFSPRLLASRINFLNPVYYAKLDPLARVEALKAMRNLIGAGSLVLFLAKQAGAQVNMDPRNADFGKMKFGNTRIDIWGGFQQPIRLVAQLLSGKIISSTSGKTLTLGPEGPGKLSRKDIIQRFGESKFSPVPSFANDALRGTDSIGQPFSWSKATYQRMLPLLAQDVYSLYRAEGALPAIGGATLGTFGFGIQNYGAAKPKAKQGKSISDPFNISGGGGSESDPWNVSP